MAPLVTRNSDKFHDSIHHFHHRKKLSNMTMAAVSEPPTSDVE
jgi:hypothetical protein